MDRRTPIRRFCRSRKTIIVAFRKHKLLSLDDYLCALQATIPHLTRAHRIAALGGMGSAG